MSYWELLSNAEYFGLAFGYSWFTSFIECFEDDFYNYEVKTRTEITKMLLRTCNEVDLEPEKTKVVIRFITAISKNTPASISSGMNC